MLHRQIKVFYVTHLYDLGHGVDAQQRGNALFLRAGREPDGRRTFKLAQGETRSARTQCRRPAAAFQLVVPLRWRSPSPTYICRGRAIFCSGSPALSCHWASQPGMRPIAKSTGNMLTGKPIAW
jgi:hypothetical protein